MNRQAIRCTLFITLCLALTLPAWAGDDAPRPGKAGSGTPPVQETPSSGHAGVDVPQAYVIGAGDILSISVWKTPELTLETAVLPDGTISFPLVGTIVAEGRTIGQLRDVLKESLNEYVTDPVVTLVVTSIQSQQIYVIGKVLQPGRFLLNARVDVLQALAMAGGPNPYADRDDIRIFRREGSGTVIFHFDYDKVSRGKDLERNIVLMRGDVIVVP
jgi:polysaccharide export outer membrane protein